MTQTETLTLDGIRATWPFLVGQIEERDPLIGGPLAACRPIALEHGVLVIGAPYRFHARWLAESAQREPLEALLGELLGASLAVRVVPIAAAREDGGL